MKNLSVQKKVGWCAVHNLINLLQDDTLEWALTEERFKGCGTEDENELLVGHNLRIVNLADIREERGHLDIKTIWSVISNIDKIIIPKEEFPAMLILMVVKRKSESELTHRVGIIKIRGRLFYTDPWNEELIEIKNSKDLMTQFHSCYSIDTFSVMDNNIAMFASFAGHFYDGLLKSNK